MGAGRTVSKRTGEELLREYNALFADKAVQKVLRYLVVRDELQARFGSLAVPGMAANQRIRDKK